MGGAGALVLGPAKPAIRRTRVRRRRGGLRPGAGRIPADGRAAGPWIAVGLGLALLTAAVLVAGRTAPAAGLAASGVALAGAHAVLMAEDERYGALALVALLAVVPATAAALRLPALRPQATGAALLAPWAAVLLARADGLLSAVVGGLLLALLAALCFAVATLRAGRPEEWVAAAVGTVAGLTAGLLSGDVEAWGQVGIQLGIAGVAAGRTRSRRTAGGSASWRSPTSSSPPGSPSAVPAWRRPRPTPDRPPSACC